MSYFCDKTIKYGLNDLKRIKKKQVILILYPFTPSDNNFQTILLPKMILAECFVTKKSTHLKVYFRRMKS